VDLATTPPTITRKQGNMLALELQNAMTLLSQWLDDGGA